MIRFSCPGCQAVYTVGPEKAGKTGKCPKCQSQFSIPAADNAGMGAPTPAPAPAPAPAPKPVADPDAPVEIAPCPSCGTALTVATQYLGMDVECPTCKNVFTAKMPGATKPKTSTSTALARSDAPFDDVEEDDRPSKKKGKRRDEDDEQDDRPSKKGKRAALDDEEPPRKSKRGDDDGDEDRPSRRKKKKRISDMECKKTTAGLLAILLGAYGVHKFYLGYSSAGVIQLIATIFTCGIAGIIPLIEGITYLTKSDEEFIRIYQIGEKQWF